MNLTKPSVTSAIICKIEYRFAKSIATYKQGSTPAHRQITFDDNHDDNYWLNIYFSPGTAQYSEPQIPDGNGVLFNQQLSMRFPGNMAGYLDYLANMDELPVVIRFSYTDGVQKLMGSPDNPVIFNSDYRDNDKSAADNFTFKCLSVDRAFLFEQSESGEEGDPAPPPPAD